MPHTTCATLGEDRNHLRTGQAPQTSAVLRNCLLAARRLDDHRRCRAGNCRHSRGSADPYRCRCHVDVALPQGQCNVVKKSGTSILCGLAAQTGATTDEHRDIEPRECSLTARAGATNPAALQRSLATAVDRWLFRL